LGKVPPDRPEKVSADFEYLTTGLSFWERHKVINGDRNALKRASDLKELIQNIIEEIEHMYFIENKEPGEIAEHIFHMQGRQVFSQSEKQELVDFIENVIKSKH
jgi:tRNA C32,U32 (ribose-2'-O)-methylase TrmJ